MLIKLILNTVKLLMKKKSYILIGIIMPAFIVVFFSFEFGTEYKYKVGIVDKDKSYASNEIIKSIDNLEDIETTKVKEKDYNILLITQQIEVAVIIDKGFEDNLLNFKEQDINIKSIKHNDVESSISQLINLKCEDLSMVASLSEKNINKFKEMNLEYNDQLASLSLNKIEQNIPKIQNTIGLMIFTIFIVAGNIASFLIEDEENKTKMRILSSGINKWKYYISMIFIFYIMTMLTTGVYYIVSKILNIDYGMEKSSYFLIVMAVFNLIAISFNLCIVSFTKSRYASTIINILIVVPCCMLSGVFWDFDIMEKSLQKVGNLMPTRWVYVCIETLQQNNNLSEINMYLVAMMIFSMGLFLISFAKLKMNNEL